MKLKIRKENLNLSKKKSQSSPSIKITGSPSSKTPGGKINGSVDGRKVSPPPKKG